uniref:non-specific serine/threonine protein kinase n=1 Tax=Cyanothece sp. (strain PCC 7425 / ATCC 29141) TaxID=395961 RepID=B8HVS4_CYAP4
MVGSVSLLAMQPPLSAGTVLHSRYTIIQLLGQGGFARTYLAEDRERFHELCVLKEFIPTQTNPYLLEKAREMFDREAAILYQIQHSQIPRFRATFEYDFPTGARLFLVQDYVAGETYRHLLNQRLSQGYTFSEAEVRHLLLQLLPVLDYIHTQGIIHRDISPENLMLRLSDQQPVLIDFGVVKEIVSRCQQETEFPGTAVGKPGYAPLEQLQTGRAYPSSDLYSLAVTAIVLLTGQEPQKLFEDRTATWAWQPYTRVKPDFACVLNRMLNYKPGDRFQSAIEVMDILQSLPLAESTAIQIDPATTTTQIKTPLLEGRTPSPPDLQSQPPPTAPLVSAAVTPVAYPRWFRLPLAGLAVVISLGSASLLWFRMLQPSPAPSALTPLSHSTANFSYNRPLALKGEGKVTVRGKVQADEVLNYQLQTQAGQVLNVTLQEHEGVQLQILSPEQVPLQSLSPLPLSHGGLYGLRLAPLPGIKQGYYQLSVSLQSLKPPPAAKPVPSPAGSQNPNTPTPRSNASLAQRSAAHPALPSPIQLPSGRNLLEVKGQIKGSKTKRYLVPVQSGQKLSAVVVNGPVTLNIRNPEGRILSNGGQVLNWQGRLGRSGTYQIEVVGIPLGNPDAVPFSLKLGLR